MPTARACLVCLIITLSSLVGAEAERARAAQHPQALVQYCVPADDYPDADRLYC